MRCRMPQVGSTDKDLEWFKDTRTPQVDEYFLLLFSLGVWGAKGLESQRKKEKKTTFSCFKLTYKVAI